MIGDAPEAAALVAAVNRVAQMNATGLRYARNLLATATVEAERYPL